MLDDRFGSDYDYSALFGHEFGPDISREDWCDEHQQRYSTCGKCQEIVTDDGPLLAAVMAALNGTRGKA